MELKADITANEVGAYSKDDADKRFQPLGKYQVEGHSYSKAETDTKYQPKGNYAPAGNYAAKGDSYTKVESDGKYQPKGSYQPSGDYATKGESYTKAESDSKYQGKGNYQVAGYSYSKSEADNKYQAKGNYVATTRKVNDKPLSGDVTVTSQDIFSNQAISIGANQNLNNYKTAGIYFQPANANATTNLNYPENMAGTLIVLKNAGITQLYYVYNTSRIYSRSQYDKGNFTPWAKEFNSQNKPTAADVGAYSKGESDEKYQPKGNYLASGYSYSKGESDGKYQPKGNYLASGYSYSKGESDSKYQPKGNYAPAGSYGSKNTANKAGSGWWKCGDTGIMQQWNEHKWSAGQSLDFKFSVPFPNTVLTIMVTAADGYAMLGTTNRTKTGFTLTGNSSYIHFTYIAIGY
ncbi:pyocin knob domain-containing protein [Proteus columbae]|uniref:pyocin knob domain-containing protein n=1 Tax=Proteus columbae TaxID=1987580 RepID=UPI002889043C|nr:pyocin knob domain-containing protein [Proteus columbae]